MRIRWRRLGLNRASFEAPHSEASWTERARRNTTATRHNGIRHSFVRWARQFGSDAFACSRESLSMIPLRERDTRRLGRERVFRTFGWEWQLAAGGGARDWRQLLSQAQGRGDLVADHLGCTSDCANSRPSLFSSARSCFRRRARKPTISSASVPIIVAV